MVKVKHIFSDMDGTLLNSQGQVSLENANLIKNSKIPFTLVSARAPFEMENAIQILGLNDLQIGFNGGLIFKKQDAKYHVIQSFPIPYQTVIDICKLIKQDFKQVTPSIYDLNTWYAEKIDSSIQVEINITHFKPTITNNLVDLIVKKHMDIYKIMFIVLDPTLLDKLYKVLADKFDNVMIQRSGTQYLEITSRDAYKSKGINYILEKEKLNKQEVAAFGDSHNDVSMLDLVGYPIAMGNAQDEIKKMAKYITKSNDENGVGYGIKHFLVENDD